MPARPKLSSDEKNLIRRYLLWCYKTTKEDLDRIDRYYTQLSVDAFVLNELRTEEKSRPGRASAAYRQLLDGFEKYMQEKKAGVDKKKFKSVAAQTLKDDYRYLQNRCKALKKAIVYFLGKKELNRIAGMYEEEMARRILEARDHT